MSQSQPAPNPAQVYEDYFVTHQFRPWTRELLDRATPQAGERILDVACGTGIVARMAAQLLGSNAQVVGLDLSAPMLEVARSAVEREGVDIEWQQGSAEELPFADGSFDLVLVQQGLQFYREKAAAVAEMHRVLAPGGRAATATWTEIENHPFHVILAEVIQRHLGTPAMHAPFALGNQDTLRSLFSDAGFEDVAIDVVRLDIPFPSPDRFVDLGVAGVSAAVPAMQTMSAQERGALTEAVRADMAGPLEQFTVADHVVVPLEANIVVARKSG